MEKKLKVNFYYDNQDFIDGTITVEIIQDMETIENKYFTPSIEDIRVGYECEMNYPMSTGWTKFVVRDTYFGRDGDGDLPDVYSAIESNWNTGNRIRVPYLTKEQIEAEGWKKEDILAYRFKDGIHFFDKENYMMLFDERNYHIEILARDVTKIEWMQEFPEKFRVTLPCKDINTFRYICKLLGV